jgi:hypothetical protein
VKNRYLLTLILVAASIATGCDNDRSGGDSAAPPATTVGAATRSASVGSSVSTVASVRTTPSTLGLMPKDATALETTVGTVLDSFQQETSASYKAFADRLGVPLAPVVNGPKDFDTAWAGAVSMLRGADLRYDSAETYWAFRGGRAVKRPTINENAAMTSRAMAGQPDLDPESIGADAIEVRIPGRFFSAIDRKSRFDGYLTLGFLQRKGDGAWIPYKAMISGWPVGIRVAHPPL